MSERIRANEIFARHDGLYFLKLAKFSQNANANAIDTQVAAFKIAKEKLMIILDVQEMNLLKQTAFDYGIVLDDMWIIFVIFCATRILLRNYISHVSSWLFDLCCYFILTLYADDVMIYK